MDQISRKAIPSLLSRHGALILPWCRCFFDQYANLATCSQLHAIQINCNACSGRLDLAVTLSRKCSSRKWFQLGQGAVHARLPFHCASVSGSGSIYNLRKKARFPINAVLGMCVRYPDGVQIWVPFKTLLMQTQGTSSVEARDLIPIQSTILCAQSTNSGSLWVEQ